MDTNGGRESSQKALTSPIPSPEVLKLAGLHVEILKPSLVPDEDSCSAENAISLPSKFRQKYRQQPCFYLVKFKKDAVMHVCQSKELVYRRRKRDKKIVPFAIYENCWYECTVLDKDTKKKTLLQHIHAAKKRLAASAITRRTRRSKNFSLVQFQPTRDYHIIANEDILEQDDGARCLVNCPDGAGRTAIMIDKGGKFHLCFCVFPY